MAVCGHPEIFQTAHGCTYGKCEDVTLQLLIIDLGDGRCVVKVEKGRMPHTSSDPIKDLGFYGDLSIVTKPFTELRAAIDALDGEKPPIPRITRGTSDNQDERLFLWYNHTDSTLLRGKDYDVLSELAGKPLPVWEPKKGEWVRVAIAQTDYDKIPIFEAWRFVVK
jgi:hypothetical protein